MDMLMKSELGLQDKDPRVLWEEDLQLATSILQILIPQSNLGKSEIKKSLTSRKLNVKDPFPSQRKRKMPVRRAPLQTQIESQIDTDVEEDFMPETKGSLEKHVFVKAGRKRANLKSAEEPEEKNWERLFRAIYYYMREMLKEQIQKRNNLRYWSSEFAISPFPDATDSWKSGLVLLDYKLRKLDSSEKSWKDVLTGIEITQSDLSSDRKILCSWASLPRVI
ncbi:uncharacterized protein HD556DRAFT_1451145 [Suillus plorans]|uniref:Uncharacterized protein n=1 Tax=Suillus plorans TaxID=116603 RepID=A0A9P7AAE6_9AGAM|nr:uncharacterized protein HD556DRAFT_1451145 [Suillus plorans]KAG1785053.1 hypothetical protein HD556DRAFT_1451145 [Suillus plorans]